MIRQDNIPLTIVVMILFITATVFGCYAIAQDNDDCCASAAQCDCGVAHCSCCTLHAFITPQPQNLPTPATSQYEASNQTMTLPVVLVPIFQPPRA